MCQGQLLGGAVTQSPPPPLLTDGALKFSHQSLFALVGGLDRSLIELSIPAEGMAPHGVIWVARRVNQRSRRRAGFTGEGERGGFGGSGGAVSGVRDVGRSADGSWDAQTARPAVTARPSPAAAGLSCECEQ